MPELGSPAERYERLKKGRQLVRRTALLLSADQSLHELLGQLAAPLSDFVDASTVQVAIGDENEARVDYILEDGIGGRPDNSQIPAQSTTRTVLRTGEPVLLRRPEDWPAGTTRTILAGQETARTISAIFVPIPFGGRTIGALSVQSREYDAYDDDDVAMLESCAIYLGARLHDEELRAKSARFERASTTDALTGLPNRRAFDETLHREWQRCGRSGASVALVMIDVDYFKGFNDAYGHVAGDGCLRQVAQAIAGCVKRPGDLAARYGGEEFALILPESELAGAVQVAESVCSAVRAIAIAHQGSSLGYTSVSVGAAAVVPHADGDPQDLVAAADAMLYEAKQNGRNRVSGAGYRSDAPAAEARVIVRHNLPSYLTESVGRKRERAEIAALLQKARLVSIVGTGGIGKTREAVEAALGSVDVYADGAWFVDLAPTEDPALVPAAIAAVFGVADAGDERPLIERVGAALKTKQLLLVLDNCEHVLSAAADAVSALLQTCPQMRILATSRAPLGTSGEQSYRMPTLPVPPEGEPQTAEAVMQYAAAALFVARARAAQHTFVLTDANAAIVGDIVRRLDGIALAIELAASRIKVLSVQQIDARLGERFKLLTGGNRDAHARQQTLHAMIGWSYDLLSEQERSLLRQSAVFRGGWTLEAVEAVCTNERFADWDALDLLETLFDKSLVVVESGRETRYRLLESIRQFAADRLTQAGEVERLAGRHGRFFADAALRAHEAFWQTDFDDWIAQVRLEWENYRAAIVWALEAGAGVEAAAIVGSLRWLWWQHARSERRMLCERTAALLNADAPGQVRGVLALAQAQLEPSAQSLAAAVQAGRAFGECGDAVGGAEALYRQGQAHGRAGRLAEAPALYEEAVAAARAARLPRLIGSVLTQMGYWLSAAGERVRARSCFNEAGALLRACNDRGRLADLQVYSAEQLFAEGDAAGALASSREAEALYRDRGMESHLGTLLLNAAAYLLALGRRDAAWATARESLELALHAGDVLHAAIAIGHLAHLAAQTGEAVCAARLLGYADAVYATTGSSREPTERRGYDRTCELLRAALTNERIAALFAEGAALDQDAAVSEALSIPAPP